MEKKRFRVIGDNSNKANLQEEKLALGQKSSENSTVFLLILMKRRKNQDKLANRNEI